MHASHSTSKESIRFDSAQSLRLTIQTTPLSSKSIHHFSPPATIHFLSSHSPPLHPLRLARLLRLNLTHDPRHHRQKPTLLRHPTDLSQEPRRQDKMWHLATRVRTAAWVRESAARRMREAAMREPSTRGTSGARDVLVRVRRQSRERRVRSLHRQRAGVHGSRGRCVVGRGDVGGIVDGRRGGGVGLAALERGVDGGCGGVGLLGSVREPGSRGLGAVAEGAGSAVVVVVVVVGAAGVGDAGGVLAGVA